MATCNTLAGPDANSFLEIFPNIYELFHSNSQMWRNGKRKKTNKQKITHKCEPDVVAVESSFGQGV